MVSFRPLPPDHAAPPTRPLSIPLTLAYAMVLACWFLWILCSTRFPTVWEEDEFSMADPDDVRVAMGFGAVLFALTLLDLRQSRRAQRDVRAGDRWGLALGLVLLVVLQFGLHSLDRGLPSSGATNPERIEAWFESREAERSGLLKALRSALASAYPEVREARADWLDPPRILFSHEIPYTFAELSTTDEGVLLELPYQQHRWRADGPGWRVETLPPGNHHHVGRYHRVRLSIEASAETDAVQELAGALVAYLRQS